MTADMLSVGRGRAAPGADELAELHSRQELVDELPERPCRFLVRLALGYSYEEIAARAAPSRSQPGTASGSRRTSKRSPPAYQHPARRRGAVSGCAATILSHKRFTGARTCLPAGRRAGVITFYRCRR
jgi:hypothetical protein